MAVHIFINKDFAYKKGSKSTETISCTKKIRNKEFHF